MTYNRRDLSVQVNIKSIKGYTMREIGALEERIKRLEYYTVLNALELDTKTLSIRDATTNLERFKNGIFADPFNDHTLGKTEDREYRIAISSSKSIARPSFTELFHNFKLVTNTSSGIKSTGRICMLNYTHEFLGGNPFATNYRNCTESAFRFNGYVRLFPNFDNINSVTQVAPQNVTIDIAGAFSDLLSTGIAQNIDTVAGGNVLADSQTESWNGDGTKTTNYWTQTNTTTVTDIAVNVKPINVDLGSYVVDVSTLPYMRSRIISVAAYGLRPNTRLYIYFDKINVTSSCAPAVVSPSYATGAGTIDSTLIQGLVGGKENDVLTQTGARGDAIFSDSKGEAYLTFLLPQNTFRSGDRTLVLTNVDNINAVDAIVTRAEGTYTSSALSLSTQSLSFSILQPTFTPTTTISSDTRTWETEEFWSPPPPNDDPVAQTFTIKESVPAGIDIRVPGMYLTKIGVYFKKKSNSLGVSCVVAGTTVGIPDRSKIVGRARLDSSEVAVSDNSSLETVFTFDSPILLQSDQLFTFWIEPDASNPDYEIWISEVGGTDILTSRAITQQPISGIMYVSSDGRSWTPIQSSDIKFKLYRAKFTSTSGTAVFSNETDDFITVSNLTRSTTSTPISVGDVVYAANTANTLQTLTNTTLNPFGIIQAMDELNGSFVIEKSNGLFNVGTYPNLRIYRVSNVGDAQEIIAQNLIANATLISIDDPSYHGVVPKFTIMEPIGTSIALNFYGTANSESSFGKDGSPTSVKNESLYLYNDYERVLRSYSNEVAAGGYGQNGSATFTMTLSTENDYVSPVIDLGVKTFNFIQNQINNDDTDENTRYGNALNKYISKNVVLNQEAEDIIVYVTGYRPSGTDIKVYGKFLNNNDNELFDIKQWTELENTTQALYSSPQDTEDYKEYVFNVPVGNTVVDQQLAYLDPTSTDPDNVLTYYDTVGSPHSGYSTFGIKILLLSTSPVKIPTMRDVRALALQR